MMQFENIPGQHKMRFVVTVVDGTPYCYADLPNGPLTVAQLEHAAGSVLMAVLQGLIETHRATGVSEEESGDRIVAIFDSAFDAPGDGSDIRIRRKPA